MKPAARAHSFLSMSCWLVLPSQVGKSNEIAIVADSRRVLGLNLPMTQNMNTIHVLLTMLDGTLEQFIGDAAGVA